jgi:hypothetical protein
LGEEFAAGVPRLAVTQAIGYNRAMMPPGRARWAAARRNDLSA